MPFSQSHPHAGLCYASHPECCLFTQLTCCSLMFRSTIDPLSPVFCVHSATWLWPTCLQHTAKVSKYDHSCQKQVKKKKKKQKKKHSVIRWRNGGIICFLQCWYPTSESILHKLSEVLYKVKTSVFSDLSDDCYLRVFGRCHMILTNSKMSSDPQSLNL